MHRSRDALLRVTGVDDDDAVPAAAAREPHEQNAARPLSLLLILSALLHAVLVREYAVPPEAAVLGDERRRFC